MKKRETQNVQVTDQVSDQVTDQVAKLVVCFGNGWKSAAELRAAVSISHAQTFRRNYMAPAIKDGLVEMSEPDSIRSPTQTYRLTAMGRALAEKLVRKNAASGGRVSSRQASAQPLPPQRRPAP